MRIPLPTAPVERCERISLYASTMLRSFLQWPQLTSYAEQLDLSCLSLVTAHAAYQKAARALVGPRVRVKVADYFADNGVRALYREVERFESGKKGRVMAALFPHGITPIIKPVGPGEIKALRDLEGRLTNVAELFPCAMHEREKLHALRIAYETALEERRTASEQVATLRHARELAREHFIDVYATVTHRVRSDYPRQHTLQELFFDDVRPSATRGDDVTSEPTEDDEAEAVDAM